MQSNIGQETCDSLLLVGSSKDTCIHILNPSNGASLYTFKDSNSSSNSQGIEYIRNRNLLVSVQEKKLSIQLYALGKESPVYKCHIPEKMGPLQATSCGQFLFAGAKSGKIYVWSVDTGALLTVWDAHYKPVSCFAITSDDQYLISGGDDAVINVWRISEVLDMTRDTTRASVVRPHTSFSDHTLPITSVKCGMGGISGRIISSSLDRSVKIFDIPSASRIYSLTCPAAITAVAMDFHETAIYMGCDDGKIYICDLVIAAKILNAKPFAVASSTSMMNTADARNWDSSTDSMDKSQCLEGHQKPILSLCVSDDGSRLISGCENGSIRVWDTQSRQSLRNLEDVQGPISSMTMLDYFSVEAIYTQNKKVIDAIAPLKKYIGSSAP